MAKRPTITARRLYLALLYAADDRASYAKADSGPWGKKAAKLAEELTAERHRLFGQNGLEKAIANSRLVNIADIQSSKKENDA